MRYLPFSLALAAFFAVGGAAEASISLQFNGGGYQGSNWADGSGAGGVAMPWGIIVDTNGNGLATSYSAVGVNFALFGSGQSLSDASGTLTDDVLLMCRLTMSIVPQSGGSIFDGVVPGENRIGTMSAAPFLPELGMDAGDPFYIAWFDEVLNPITTPSGTPVSGDKYGIFGDSSFVIPENSFNVSYSQVFEGVDAMKTMGYTWGSGTQAAPEPSSVMLGLPALALLLRRKRRGQKA